MASAVEALGKEQVLGFWGWRGAWWKLGGWLGDPESHLLRAWETWGTLQAKATSSSHR